jgi:pimeloyl-ACP methyl ester carboxylesterase
MSELPVQSFKGRDGIALVYRELGVGQPLLLLHGYFSNAQTNWLRFGHAATIAARGHRVIMPDLRGHGSSARPHDSSAYPPGVLVDDAFALIEQLGLTEYDLGGYSLGGRTILQMVAHGATPGRAIAAGVGLADIIDISGSSKFFRRVLTNLGTFERGSSEGKAEAFMKSGGGDPVALLHVLQTFVDIPRDALARIVVPTLVLIGNEDDRAGQALAAAIPNSQYAVVPGDHMSAVAKPDLGLAMADFLDRPAGDWHSNDG